MSLRHRLRPLHTTGAEITFAVKPRLRTTNLVYAVPPFTVSNGGMFFQLALPAATNAP